MAQNRIVQASLTGAWYLQPWANVTHWEADIGDPDITPAAADSLGAALALRWKVNLSPLMVDTSDLKAYRVSVMGVVIDDPSHPGRRTFDPIYSGPLVAFSSVGSIGTDGLPSFNAVCVNEKTASGFRRYRGNMHLVGLPEADTVGQYITVARTAVWQTAVDAVYTTAMGVTVGPDTWTFRAGVFSRKFALANGLGTNPYVYIQPFRQCIVNRRTGTMTRRKTKLEP